MTPDPTALYITFCLHVRSLCEQFNASVVSWWRSEQHNREQRGHVRSFHLEGLAADLHPDDPADQKPIADEARALGLQVSLHTRGVHVELDYRDPTPPRATTPTA